MGLRFSFCDVRVVEADGRGHGPRTCRGVGREVNPKIQVKGEEGTNRERKSGSESMKIMSQTWCESLQAHLIGS